MRFRCLYFCIILFLLVVNISSGEIMTSSEFLQKADSVFKARDFEQAMTLYTQASKNAEQEGDTSVLVESYSQIARCHLKNEDHEKCAEWLEKAKALASADYPTGWSRYLGVRGRLEWQKAAREAGEPDPVVDKARETFEEMYDYCMAHDLYERAIDAAHMVAIVGNLEQRLAWGKKGIEAAEKGDINGWLPALWNNHGWNLDDAGRHEEALAALKKAREYHYKAGNELSKLIADWSVGYAFRMVGDLDSAKTWMLKVSRQANMLYETDKSGTNAEWVGYSSKELGEIALAENNKPLALEMFTRAERNLKQAGMPDWDKKGYNELLEKINSLHSE